MPSSTAVRLATRGSALARRQAATVQSKLATRRREVTLTEVDTAGDQVRDELIHRLGRTGAFVRALDETVLAGDLDAAVHSLKDMPTEMPDSLVVAAVPERAPTGDVLVTPEGHDLESLPEGARVGTGSLRRRAQLLAARPDLEIVPIRGNVDTRLEKLLAPSLQREHEARLEAHEAGTESPKNDYDRTPEAWFEGLSELERRALGREVDVDLDAVVLAEAGLRRSGLFESVDTAALPRESFVPAPGQGAIAVTAADPDVIEQLRDAVDYPRSRIETTVERTVLAELGGGCIAPIGVSAILRGEYVHTRVQVLNADGSEVVADTRDIPVTDHASGAAAFAADLRERGAADLIQAATREIEGADDDG